MIDSAVSVAEPVETGRMSDDQREGRKANRAHCPHRGSLLAIADPDREVRIRVADRLPAEKLERLAADPDYLFRQYVAKPMPASATRLLAWRARGRN